MLLEAQPLRGLSPCSGRALLRVRSRQQSISSARLPITSVCGGPWDSTSACASARPAVQPEQHASTAFSRWRTPPSRRSARQQPWVPAATSGASALNDGSLQEPSSDASPSAHRVRRLGLTALVAVAAALAAYSCSAFAPLIKDWAKSSGLSRSGFPAAFAIIFVSEIGDKTFFIAALLAMKVGRLMSFAASLAALSAMTVVSVAIGRSFRHVPAFLQSSLPIGEWAGAAMMVYFGVRTLRDAWMTKAEPGTASSQDEELEGAEEQISSAEREGRMVQETPWQAFVGVASLIFLAEFGDRSMLATIALAAAQSPVGVAAGAIAGHAIATGIAVVGGALAGKYVSEQTVNYVSGTLFLVFAAATLLGVY